MTNQLFIIKNDDGICAIFADLESAKNELKNIYNTTPDFKLYGYQIVIYDLIGKQYMAREPTDHYPLPNLVSREVNK
jgi:hypothetical protein